MEWVATYPVPHDDKTCPICSKVVFTDAYKRGVAEANRNAAIAKG